MGKKKHRSGNVYGQATHAIQTALQLRALDRVGPLGHILSPWAPAKKRFGSGSQKALCTKCGREVILTPRLIITSKTIRKEHQIVEVPALRGEAIFGLCIKDE